MRVAELETENVKVKAEMIQLLDIVVQMREYIEPSDYTVYFLRFPGRE